MSETLLQKLQTVLDTLHGADPYLVLNVDSSVSEKAARAAFLQATKRWHPNRFARFSEPVHDIATEIFLLFRSAYDSVRSEISPNGSSSVITKGTGPSADQKQAPAATNSDSTKSDLLEEIVLDIDSLSQGEKKQLTRANQCLEKGDWKTAKNLYSSLSTSHPQSAVLKALLCLCQGYVQAKSGKLQAASMSFKRCLRVQPEFTPAKKALHKLQTKQHNSVSQG